MMSANIRSRSSHVNASAPSQQWALSSQKDGIPESRDIESSDAIVSNESLTSLTAYEGTFAANPRGPIKVFGFDLSNHSGSTQYGILAGGLIFVMCLYGYFQELVVYGWFQRKLSIFSTFLHFVGCFILCVLQRRYQKDGSVKYSPINKASTTGCISGVAETIIGTGSHDGGNDNMHSIDIDSDTESKYHGSSLHSIWNKAVGSAACVFHMGTATASTALFYYCLMVLSKTMAQGMSNLSMTQINYPAKVLFKSASPVITMIIGMLFGKTYPYRDFAVVLLLLGGLWWFLTDNPTGQTKSLPQCTTLGVIYIVLSLIGSAAVPMIQEHVIELYNVSVEELLYNTFLGSMLATFFLSIGSGELPDGVLFLIQNGSVRTWVIFSAFTTFGFLGANFSTALTKSHGALVNGITNTFRKALNLAISFVMFPERNTLTSNKLFGAGIFFAGLLIRVFIKDGVSNNSGKNKGAKEDKDKYKMTYENYRENNFDESQPDLKRGTVDRLLSRSQSCDNDSRRMVELSSSEPVSANDTPSQQQNQHQGFSQQFAYPSASSNHSKHASFSSYPPPAASASVTPSSVIVAKSSSKSSVLLSTLSTVPPSQFPDTAPLSVSASSSSPYRTVKSSSSSSSAPLSISSLSSLVGGMGIEVSDDNGRVTGDRVGNDMSNGLHRNGHINKSDGGNSSSMASTKSYYRATNNSSSLSNGRTSKFVV